LTSHRILIKDGKGLSGKRKNFQSIPYYSINAFSVETSGSGLDQDTELKVWTSSYVNLKFEFGKAVVDIFAIQTFMNDKCLSNNKGVYEPQDSVVSNHYDIENASIIDWLGDNAQQFNPALMEDKLKNQYPVLMNDEKVELAYKCWRDYAVFTSRRILAGCGRTRLFWKRVEFKFIPWEHVRGYAIETAGSFLDRDSELNIFTAGIGGEYCTISQDFRKGKADLWAIQACLNNHILGKDEGMLPEIDQRPGHVDPETSWWGRSNSRPLDAAEMNRVFHTAPPILQSKEVVGISGKQVKYRTTPMKWVKCFQVETAGFMDSDAEVYIQSSIPGMKRMQQDI
jgi:Bacterial PH domain